MRFPSETISDQELVNMRVSHLEPATDADILEVRQFMQSGGAPRRFLEAFRESPVLTRAELMEIFVRLRKKVGGAQDKKAFRAAWRGFFNSNALNDFGLEVFYDDSDVDAYRLELAVAVNSVLDKPRLPHDRSFLDGGDYSKLFFDQDYGMIILVQDEPFGIDMRALAHKLGLSEEETAKRVANYSPRKHAKARLDIGGYLDNRNGVVIFRPWSSNELRGIEIVRDEESVGSLWQQVADVALYNKGRVMATVG